MVVPPNPPQPGRKTSGALLALVSWEFRWFYRIVLAFLLVVGVAFVTVGLDHLERWWSLGISELLTGGIVYTSLGLLVLIFALGVQQMRRYLLRIQKETADQIASVELNKLGEDDFEGYERVRRIREEKAQRDFELNLGATFVVQRFEAREVKLFPQADWELQPGVNVLLGRNGYGKSLLLKALAGLLQRDEEATALFFSDSIDSLASIEVRMKRNGEDALIQRNAVRFAKSVGKVPLLAIPDSRFLDRSQATIGPDESDTNDLRTHGAYHFLHQKPYVPVIQGLLYEICLDYWEHGHNLDLPVFQFLQECVRRLTGFDFRFHSIKRSGRTGFEVRVLTEGSPDPLPIQYASQGTLSLLSMFGLMRSYLRAVTTNSDDALVQKGSAIVLIDEADAHLHPVWQQKVTSLLKDLFPNVQFILSAHSPLFVAGCWKGEVAVLRRAKSRSPGSGFRIEQLDHDFVGATAAEIYSEIFEVEEMDETYLKYATKASLRKESSGRINELSARREENGLSPDEEQELQQLMEESRRIHRAMDVKQRRREESAKDLRIAELESQILKLKTQRAATSQEKTP
ncbi:MAG TPA: AAA family ATPase [Thermoanaerobaculia bacterium]|nr:AAA family ATPase [Thermoanaerobaculia bacterium]